MYAVIRQVEFDKARREEANRKVQDVLVPVLKKIPGFVAYYWLETGEGSGASLSVYKDKSGAEESVRSAVDFVKQHLADVTKKTEIIQGEVKAHGCSDVT